MNPDMFYMIFPLSWYPNALYISKAILFSLQKVNNCFFRNIIMFFSTCLYLRSYFLLLANRSNITSISTEVSSEILLDYVSLLYHNYIFFLFKYTYHLIRFLNCSTHISAFVLNLYSLIEIRNV